MRAESWELPYPSVRHPVCAEQVVATSQPQAVAAGMAMFERGGNAADAALAAAMALTVVEPTSNGIGGDALAVVVEPDGSVVGLDASGAAPAALDAERLRAQPAMPLRGWDPVTVPGAVSAWSALHARFASLELPALAQPAVRLAREGFRVGPVTAAAWAHAPAAYDGFEAFAATFLPEGGPPRAGQRIALPDHAATLERIAASGGEAFYRGELADRIDAHAAATGGALRGDDLAAHQARWVRPLARPAGELTVHELPPSGQGLAALVALGVLAHTPVADLDPDDPTALHLQIEATKQGLADARRHVADPASMRVHPGELLEDARLLELAGRIADDRAGDPGHGPGRADGTVYLCAADAHGRAVSFIQSNYTGFGSGIVVPGTGIALHNRGAGFVTDAEHPNAVGPGRRPFHTLMPGAATGPGGQRAAFGVMGGPMQPQGHVQLACRSALAGQGPQAAVDAPRWRVEAGRRVHMEPGLTPRVRQALTDRGHEITVDPPDTEGSFGFGGAQAAVALPSGGWTAASDPRKEGHAAGR